MLNTLSLSYISFALSIAATLMRMKRVHTQFLERPPRDGPLQLYSVRHRNCFLYIFISQIMTFLPLSIVSLSVAVFSNKTLFLSSTLLCSSIIRQTAWEASKWHSNQYAYHPLSLVTHLVICSCMFLPAITLAETQTANILLVVVLSLFRVFMAFTSILFLHENRHQGSGLSIIYATNYFKAYACLQLLLAVLVLSICIFATVPSPFSLTLLSRCLMLSYTSVTYSINDFLSDLGPVLMQILAARQHVQFTPGQTQPTPATNRFSQRDPYFELENLSGL